MPFSTTYARFKSFVNGGSLLPSDLNSIQDDFGNQLAGVNVAGGFNEGANVRRGKCIVPGTDVRSNAAYGVMTTPDQVAGVVLPSSSLLHVAYQATWQESVSGAARAAVFIGANQLKQAFSGQAAPIVQAASIGGTNVNRNYPLGSSPIGLVSKQTIADPEAAYTGDVTTGQILGGGHSPFDSANYFWGFFTVFGVAAGTYTVSVQFKASSGLVTASARSLWVWTQS
jgi:hypothetical protein